MDKENTAQSSIKSIFNRNFNVVTLVNFIVMIAYYQIFVTSAFYAQEHFDVSLSTAGSTAGIMVIGCLIGRFFTGNLLSRFGCKSVLIVGTLLYLAGDDQTIKDLILKYIPNASTKSVPYKKTPIKANPIPVLVTSN